MPNWMIVLLLITVAALAFWLGRLSAGIRIRIDPASAPEPDVRPAANNDEPSYAPFPLPSRRASAPPPVLAGPGARNLDPAPPEPRSQSRAPAASAGGRPATDASASTTPPRRSSKPPAAQAAWSTPPADDTDR